MNNLVINLGILRSQIVSESSKFGSVEIMVINIKEVVDSDDDFPVLIKFWNEDKNLYSINGRIVNEGRFRYIKLVPETIQQLV